MTQRFSVACADLQKIAGLEPLRSFLNVHWQLKPNNVFCARVHDLRVVQFTRFLAAERPQNLSRTVRSSS